MKFVLFPLAFCLACCAGIAQQRTVDFFVAPGISNRVVSGNSIVSLAWDDEQIAFAFRKSAAHSMALGKNTSLSIGFGYAFLGSRYVFDTSDIRWGSQWNGNEFDPSLPGEEGFGKLKVSTRVQLLEAPIAIRRYVGAGKIRPFVELAAVPSLRVATKRKSNTNVSSQVSRNNDRFDRSFQLAARAGFGLERHFTEQLAGFVQLSGQYGLLEEDLDTRTHLWDAGIQLGMRVAL